MKVRAVAAMYVPLFWGLLLCKLGVMVYGAIIGFGAEKLL
jgi:hypothetical protein